MKKLIPIETEVGHVVGEEKVTTEQFILMMIRSIHGPIEQTGNDCFSQYLDYALYKGIIEDYDLTHFKHPIERRAAARIVHEALLTELLEKDEVKWSAAENLIDLYSCRTCVMHIAQVYVKGIMLARENNVFDVKGYISISEAEEIIVRMLDAKKRTPKTEDKNFSSEH